MVDKMKKLDTAIDELNDQVASMKSFSKVLTQIDDLVKHIEELDGKASENLKMIEAASKALTQEMENAKRFWDQYQKSNTKLLSLLHKAVLEINQKVCDEIDRKSDLVKKAFVTNMVIILVAMALYTILLRFI